MLVIIIFLLMFVLVSELVKRRHLYQVLKMNGRLLTGIYIVNNFEGVVLWLLFI
jgi:hypothetical protein